MARDVIDISHRIRDGMPAYPGLPSAVVGLLLDHERSRPKYDHQAEFAIGRFELVGNVGTYVDSPFHRYRDGRDVSELPLERLVDLATVVVDAREDAARQRSLDLLLEAGPLAGRAVLIRTGWDERWGTDAYWEPGPFLGGATLERLVDGRPAVVGVDFSNVDDPQDPSRPAHTRLLGAGIPIVEHLTRLGEVADGARTFVVPLAIERAPSLPVRAFAISPR
jgi:kynurenine formamidase